MSIICPVCNIPVSMWHDSFTCATTIEYPMFWSSTHFYKMEDLIVLRVPGLELEMNKVKLTVRIITIQSATRAVFNTVYEQKPAPIEELPAILNRIKSLLVFS